MESLKDTLRAAETTALAEVQRWREAANQLNRRLAAAGLPHETGPGWAATEPREHPRTHRRRSS